MHVIKQLVKWELVPKLKCCQILDDKKNSEDFKCFLGS